MAIRPSYSVALPPSKEVTAYARAAAELGYARVWVFDSPSLYGDVWVALARIAEAVPGIGLATGVAVPSLRHPMVTASAIATIEDLSPGEVVGLLRDRVHRPVHHGEAEREVGRSRYLYRAGARALAGRRGGDRGREPAR